MLTRLGKPAAQADAVDLLLECHVRIRDFLAMARRVGEARGTAPEELAQAAARVHRYFTQALPLHAQDEEDSILPRLRGRDAALDRALADMAREHGEHERPLAVLAGACAEVARDPARLAPLAPVLLAATGELERHFAVHLEREEAVVFPAIRRLLAAGEDAAIVAEIRRRRGVEP
jgi:iron-sulfur cluster repair protein YtfE (RIC family)